MMVRIRYPDGRYDMVKVSQLERLIAANLISGFRRATGWVVIGRDPIRRNSRGFYPGPERRHSTGSLPSPGQRGAAGLASLGPQENRPPGYPESKDG